MELLFFIPALAWCVSLFVSRRAEGALYRLALAGPLAVAVALGVWAAQGAATIPADGPVLYRSHHGDFVLRFLLDGTGPRVLVPGRKPFHTLNPAMARLADGRTMVYGTMGGEGQPQTQSALFSRYAMLGQPLQAAITAPRWLLGKTWGQESVTLKLESRFDPRLVEALIAAGHDVEMLPAFTSTMGHAGAVVHHADGVLEGASDPRSDGAALGF